MSTKERRELVRYCQEIEGLKDEGFVTQEKYKKAREAWVLCRFLKIYNENSAPKVTYVSEQEGPDFALFSADDERSKVCEVEVTEIQEPGRRRGDEYKRGIPDYTKSAPSWSEYTEDELVQQTTLQLRKKFSTAYPDGTWFVIYFNVWSLSEGAKLAERVVEKTLHSLTAPLDSPIWVVTGFPVLLKVR
jgi:hypothetical protein